MLVDNFRGSGNFVASRFQSAWMGGGLITCCWL